MDDAIRAKIFEDFKHNVLGDITVSLTHPKLLNIVNSFTLSKV